MSYKTSKPEELSGFGRRLRELADNKDIVSDAAAATIATALRDNSECYKLVKPHDRTSEKLQAILSDPNLSEMQIKNIRRDYDIKAIAGQVKKHYNTEDAFKVSSEYIYAYHILFKCSIDYLYGLTDVECPDIEVRTICEKTGLTERAVRNLQAYQISGCSKCWSKMLSSELLFDVTERWEYAAAHYLHMQKLLSEYNQIQSTIRNNPANGEVLYEQDIKIGKEIQSTELAYNGILFKITRLFADFIEADIREAIDSDR